MNGAATELDYTQRMNADINWALREGGMFFQNESEVQKSLRRITVRLNVLGIDYAVVGGMALFLHGFRRFTLLGSNAPMLAWQGVSMLPRFMLL
jgi:hypothetical protein